jgi:hypothetical protein
MNCHECQVKLQEFLDGQPRAGESALEPHLAECAECRQRFTAAQRLLDGLAALVQATPAPDLSDKIVARVLEDRRAFLRGLRVSAGFALAASILLAVVGYYWLRATESNQVARGPEPRKVEPPSADQPVLTHTVQGMRTELATLTERLTDKVTEQTELLPLAAAAPLETASLSSLPLDKPLAATTQSLRQTTHGVSAGMQPVADVTRRALTYFLRKLPPMQPGKAATE